VDEVVWGNSLQICPEQEGGDYEPQDCCRQKARFWVLRLLFHGDLLWLIEDASEAWSENNGGRDKTDHGEE